MCVFISSTAVIRNISYVKKNWAKYDQNVYRSLCCVPVIHVRLQLNLSFPPDRFKKKKKTQISIFTKIRLMGSELFHADRWTDVTKLTVAFRNFAHELKKKWSTFETRA